MAASGAIDQQPSGTLIHDRLGQSLNRSDLEREIPGLGSQWSIFPLEQDGQIDNRRQLMRALERAC